MSVGDLRSRLGLDRLNEALASGAAFQYSGAVALFCMGAAGSFLTQAELFDSARIFWSAVMVALVLNAVVALLVVTVYAFWIENRPQRPAWALVLIAMAIGMFRIWYSHELQRAVDIPSLLRSDFGFLAGAVHGLLWYVPVSLFFHNAARFNEERALLLTELADNQLRERSRAVIANALAEQLTTSVAARVAQSVSQTRSTVANALTYQDSTVALRGIAESLRKTIDSDLRPMSRELWAQPVARDVSMGWRTLLELSCYDRPFPLFVSAVMVLGLGLPLSLSLQNPTIAVSLNIVQVWILVLFLGVVDRDLRAPGSKGFWLPLLASGAVVSVPALMVSAFGLPRADSNYWLFTSFVGVPILVFFSSLVTGLAGTREAILERVRKYVDEAAVAREVSARELHQVSQKLARHLHSSLQGRLMAISLELEQAADQGRSGSMGEVLKRLDTLLEAPLVGAFEEGAVDVEPALRKLIGEWSAVADVTLQYEPNWSGPLQHGQLIIGIAEEAIANAVRHGHASTIALQVRGIDHDVVVVVENDGTVQPIGQPGVGTRWLDQVSRNDWQLQPLDTGGMRLRVRLTDVVPVGSA